MRACAFVRACVCIGAHLIYVYALVLRKYVIIVNAVFNRFQDGKDARTLAKERQYDDVVSLFPAVRSVQNLPIPSGLCLCSLLVSYIGITTNKL